MPGDKKEHRRHKRYGIKSCTVQHKIASFLGLFGRSSEKYLVLDISPNGLNFISKESFKKQTQISLIITAPILKEETIHTKGKVVWVKKSPGLNVYGIGIEFVSIGKSDRNKLKRVVDNAIQDKIDISTRVDLKKADPL